MRRTLSIDKIIWILTVALIASFLIFNTNSIGSMVLFTISVLIFSFSAYKSGFVVSFGLGRMHAYIFIFGMYCLCTSIWAWEPKYAIEKGITILEILVCMSMLWVYYAQKDSVEDLLKAVMWAGFIVALYYFKEQGTAVIFTAIRGSVRAGSKFANVNNVAMISSYAIIISLYYAVNKTGVFTVLTCVMMSIPGVILVAASGSRKGLVALVIGIVAVLAKRFESKNFLWNIIKVGLVLIATYVALIKLSQIPFFSGIAGRMEGLIALVTGNGKVDHSALQRQWYIDAGMEQFKKNPILGIGFGNSRVLLLPLFGHATYTHNNYVELLCCGGMIGFALFYSMYIHCIVDIWKYRKTEDNMTMLVVLMIFILLVMDYGAVSYYVKDMYFYFMIFFLHARNLKQKPHAVFTV